MIRVGLLVIATVAYGQIDAGDAAMVKRDYAAARAAFESAVSKAEGDAPVVTATRKLAGACRLQGQLEEAEQMLIKLVPVAVRAHGDLSQELADVLSELAGIQRSARKLNEAMLNYDSAVQIRRKASAPGVALVRDLAFLGRTLIELEDFERAMQRYQEALDVWDASQPQDSPEALGILDALAALHRDAANYEGAEVLLRRALHTREATYGPESAELISTLDSLAYALFGMKKHAEAEPVYHRLLAIWKASAGPEHPMVALTLEKMAEFYASQGKYTEAEPLVREALQVRTLTHLQSLHQTGRILLMQAKLSEADVLYRQAVRLGDEAGMSEEIMDPLLRVHAQILRELKKPVEAAALEKRYKEANARTQKLRPSPVKLK